MHAFLSRWNCVHKTVPFLLIRTCVTSYWHTELPSFFIWLLETHAHEELDEKISSQSGLVLKMWAQVTEMRLNGESTAKRKNWFPQPRTFLVLQSQTRMPFICHSGYTALIMNPISYLVMQATPSQNGEESGCNHQVTFTPECCHERCMLFVAW